VDEKTPMFNTSKHKEIRSDDGSFTAYSAEYDEHYHSTKDGALNESLCKHVLPALKHTQDREEIVILDICFGLGFNTLATLYALKESGKKVRIYSPELDEELVRSLENFVYPEEFEEFKAVILALSRDQRYSSEDLQITLILGDAREFVKNTDVKFDIVYQDAFSPKSNPLLWTSEYFKDISALMKPDAILTTYSISLATRIALHENGLNVYLHTGEGFRSATIASKSASLEYEKVDVVHKMRCNPEATALKDARL
jgi:tRNA U34 5-methylaminomethyl-2-thiouridine-forming methyltransferase MnmC